MWMSARPSWACARVAAVSTQWVPSSAAARLDTSSVTVVLRVKVEYDLGPSLDPGTQAVLQGGGGGPTGEGPAFDPVCLRRCG
jgi:hypothetical protein